MASKYITFKGITKDYTNWASEIGISPRSLGHRMQRHQRGEITLDEAMASKKPAGNPNAGGKGGKPLGLKVQAAKAFFEGLAELTPHLRDEFEFISKGGKMGAQTPVLALYHKFADKIFPKSEVEALDGKDAQPLAQMAIVFQGGEQPKGFTLVD